VPGPAAARACTDFSCFSKETRVDDCGLLLLTVFVFMLIFLKWAAVARPRSQIVLAHVFADVA